MKRGVTRVAKPRPQLTLEPLSILGGWRPPELSTSRFKAVQYVPLNPDGKYLLFDRLAHSAAIVKCLHEHVVDQMIRMEMIVGKRVIYGFDGVIPMFLKWLKDSAIGFIVLIVDTEFPHGRLRKQRSFENVCQERLGIARDDKNEPASTGNTAMEIDSSLPFGNFPPPIVVPRVCKMHLDAQPFVVQMKLCRDVDFRLLPEQFWPRILDGRDRHLYWLAIVAREENLRLLTMVRNIVISMNRSVGVDAGYWQVDQLVVIGVYREPFYCIPALTYQLDFYRILTPDDPMGFPQSIWAHIVLNPSINPQVVSFGFETTSIRSIDQAESFVCAHTEPCDMILADDHAILNVIVGRGCSALEKNKLFVPWQLTPRRDGFVLTHNVAPTVEPPLPSGKNAKGKQATGPSRSQKGVAPQGNKKDQAKESRPGAASNKDRTITTDRTQPNAGVRATKSDVVEHATVAKKASDIAPGNNGVTKSVIEECMDQMNRAQRQTEHFAQWNDPVEGIGRNQPITETAAQQPTEIETLSQIGSDDRQPDDTVQCEGEVTTDEAIEQVDDVAVISTVVDDGSVHQVVQEETPESEAADHEVSSGPSTEIKPPPLYTGLQPLAVVQRQPNTGSEEEDTTEESNEETKDGYSADEDAARLDSVVNDHELSFCGTQSEHNIDPMIERKRNDENVETQKSSSNESHDKWPAPSSSNAAFSPVKIPSATSGPIHDVAENDRQPIRNTQPVGDRDVMEEVRTMSEPPNTMREWQPKPQTTVPAAEVPQSLPAHTKSSPPMTRVNPLNVMTSVPQTDTLPPMPFVTTESPYKMSDHQRQRKIPISMFHDPNDQTFGVFGVATQYVGGGWSGRDTFSNHWLPILPRGGQ